MTPDEMRAAVARRENLILERVRHLVEIESPSGDREASTRITDVLIEWFGALDVQIETVRAEAGTHLLIEAPGTTDEAPLLLIGHSDTVWPSGTLDTSLPWSVQDGVVRGPGAFDMKSGLVMILSALELLKGRPRRSVRILINADEEIGSPTSQDLVRRAVAGAAGAIGFESPHPDGAFKVGRRGSTRIHVEVTGHEAHAALDPDKGVSAIDELVDQLLVLRGIVEEASLSAPVLFNVGTVSGGTRANVVPGQASAEIGLRFLDAVTERAVLERFADLAPVRRGAVVTTKVLSSRPAWKATSADAALLREVSLLAEGFGWDATGRPAAGAGDTNLVGALGVPTIDGFGPAGAGSHAADEHFLLPDLYRRTALLAALLQR